MGRILVAAVALTLWWSGTWAYTVTPMGPGGGGVFSCVDKAGSVVLVGSDNGGIYKRDGTTGNWLRRGSQQGLNSNQIFALKAASSSAVYAGTADGLYQSNDAGDTWSKVGGSVTGSQDICAIGCQSTSNVLVGWRQAGAIHLAKYNGSTWSAVTVGARMGDTTGASNVRTNKVPVKIISDGSSIWYVLTGINSKSASKPSSGPDTLVRCMELWRTFDSGSSWDRIAWVNSLKVNILDIAQSGTAGTFAITTAQDVEDRKRGDIVIAQTNSTDHSLTWSVQALPMTDTDSTATNLSTGAVWYSGSDLYMQTIRPDACGSTTSGTPNGRAGRYKSANGGSWSRLDDGRTSGQVWETGWTDCTRARGETNENTSSSLSSDGEYWVGNQFAWRYDSTPKYVRVFTDHDAQSAYNTTRIDNANAAALEVVSSSAIWVGYYDLGLWKYTGSGWENHNDVDWVNSTWGGKGGAVNGILPMGNGTMFITAAADGSSKGNDWRLFYSNAYGNYDTWLSPSESPNHGAGLPVVGDHSGTITEVFLNSLTRDANTGDLWVSASVCSTAIGGSSRWQRIYTSADGGHSWAPRGVGTLPDQGDMVVHAYARRVLVGGWSGIWYSADGVSFSQSSGVTAPTPTDDNAQNITTHLHRHLWFGAHDIYMDPTSGAWFVCLYTNAGALANGTKGLCYSTNGGQTFSQLIDRDMIQACAVDSCGYRVHVVSGRGFSSPVSGSADLAARGVETCRWDVNTSTWTCGGDFDAYIGRPADNDAWGFMQAHTIRVPDDYGLYVLSPGYGLQEVTAAGACSGGGGGCFPEPCEIERTNPSGGQSAIRSHEEPAKRPRTIFTAKDARAEIEAGRLTLYDLSGRKTNSPKPGVFFFVNRSPAGVVTARRTVVVTP